MKNLEQSYDLSFLSAEDFYKKSLPNQRRYINEQIRSAMNTSGNPIIKFPFLVYEKIVEEMTKLGWIEVSEDETHEALDGSMFYPQLFEDSSKSFTTDNPNAEFVSAEEYYNKTLEKQAMDISVAIDSAAKNGEPEIKLQYQAYPIVKEFMESQGWEHEIWFPDSNKEQPCSLFYPQCGY